MLQARVVGKLRLAVRTPLREETPRKQMLRF